MLKYAIIPSWLEQSLITNDYNLDTALNYNILVSILSAKELIFYIQCNHRTYSDIYINSRVNKLFNRLLSDGCVNQIASQNEFINYMERSENLPYKISNDTCFIKALIDNPILPVSSSSLICDFRAVRLCKDVLGFIPMKSEVVLNEYSVRRDIYEVMRSFMSVDDIIQSPIFGI